MPRRAEKIRIVGLLSGLVRAFAVLGAVALILWSGSASAVLLTTNNSLTTTAGVTFTLTTCTNKQGTGACGVGTMTLTANGQGIAITGASGGKIESVTTGTVDTFLQFTVTAPIQAVASFGVIATGCGNNPTVTGCSASNSPLDAAGTTVYASTDQTFSVINLATEPINFNGTTTTSVSATSIFTPVSTFYVKMDITAQILSGTGYASFDSMTVMVPEPASWAVFGLGLVGFGLLRRRRACPDRLPRASCAGDAMRAAGPVPS